MELFFKAQCDYEMYSMCLTAKRKFLDSIMYINDKKQAKLWQQTTIFCQR